QPARQLIAEGKIGEVRQVRAQYLQDWLADADAPLSWRLDKTVARSGALGAIGAPITDLVQCLTGQPVTGGTARTEAFVTERPTETERVGIAGVGGDELGAVTVDDTAMWLARLSGGAVGTFEATRYAWGRKNALRVEISGTAGAIAFDL